MNIERNIAVSPVVKKYIAHKHDINPFIISRTNVFGIFLHNSLIKIKVDPAAEQVRIEKTLNLKVYSQELTLGLSEDLWSRKGWYIAPQRQYDFNRMVELMVEADFYFWVEVQTLVLSEKMDRAFYEFRELFHFTEDDLTLKTMQKRYERYREQIKR